MAVTTSQTATAEAEEMAEFSSIFEEIGRLNEQIAADQARVAVLKQETAALKAESDRLRDETLPILTRLKALVAAW